MNIACVFEVHKLNIHYFINLLILYFIINCIFFIYFIFIYLFIKFYFLFYFIFILFYFILFLLKPFHKPINKNAKSSFIAGQKSSGFLHH